MSDNGQVHRPGLLAFEISRLEVSLYTLLQVFSVTVFEKMPIQAAILAIADDSEQSTTDNQLNLFTF